MLKEQKALDRDKEKKNEKCNNKWVLCLSSISHTQSQL